MPGYRHADGPPPLGSERPPAGGWSWIPDRPTWDPNPQPLPSLNSRFMTESTEHAFKPLEYTYHSDVMQRDNLGHPGLRPGEEFHWTAYEKFNPTPNFLQDTVLPGMALATSAYIAYEYSLKPWYRYMFPDETLSASNLTIGE